MRNGYVTAAILEILRHCAHSFFASTTINPFSFGENVRVNNVPPFRLEIIILFFPFSGTSPLINWALMMLVPERKKEEEREGVTQRLSPSGERKRERSERERDRADKPSFFPLD